MYGLFPLPALHSHASPSPNVQSLFDGVRVTQGIILTEEEQGRRSNGVIMENLDAPGVEVCCLGFEEPEVKHGHAFDQALQTWQQSLAEA